MTQFIVWCYQKILDTKMLRSFNLFAQSQKAYSDGAISENPCPGQSRNEHSHTPIFLRQRNNIISTALLYYSRVA